MWGTRRSYFEVCLHPPHLLRTGAITFIVGTWLTLFNQGGLLLAGQFTGGLGVKVFLNYLTPFVVSNWGLIARRSQN